MKSLSGLASWSGPRLARSGAHRPIKRDGVGVGGEQRLPGGVVRRRIDGDVERPEDLQTGRLGERLLHADGAVLQHREAGEAVPDDHLAGRLGATEQLEHLAAEDAPGLHRALADVRSVDARAQQVELDDGNARLDDVVEPVGHRLAGHRDRQSVDARPTRAFCGRGQLGVGVAAGRTGDLDVDAEVLGGELAPHR